MTENNKFLVRLRGIGPTDEAMTVLNLANLFKCEPVQIRALLQEGGHVVKRGVNQEVAQRYRQAIEASGALCEIVPEPRTQEFELPGQETAQKKGADDAPTDALPVENEEWWYSTGGQQFGPVRLGELRKMVAPGMQHACLVWKEGMSDWQPLNRVLPQTPEMIPPPRPASSAKSAADLITGKLGLESIEGFSLSKFFSEVFGRHDPSEVEQLLSVGTPATTPSLNRAMGVMPSPWIFFRVLVGALITYAIFVMGWNAYRNLNLIPGLIIIGSFAVPFSVLILFFELNTPKNVSIIRLVQMVVIGGALSLLVSLILFEVTPFLGAFGASAAGIVEETGKLAALLFALRSAENERYRYRLNALLLGAAVGTGFAAFESAGYAFRAGTYGSSEAMLGIIQLRGIMSPFGHIAWTAMAASAYWIARPYFASATDTVFSSRFLKFFAIPVTLHFVWNMPFEGPFMLKYIALGFVGWVVVISLVQSGLKEVAMAAHAGQ